MWTRRLLFAVCASFVGVGLGWVLAYPAGPSPSVFVRVCAVGLGSTVFGLAALTWVGRDDRRPLVSPTEFWQWIAALTGAWAVAEAVLLVLGAADVQAGRVVGLSVGQFVQYLTDSPTGRVGGAATAIAAALTIGAVVAYRRAGQTSAAAVLVVSGLALVVRPVTGHMSQQLFGSALGAVHVLAAALWLGGLVALIVAARTRSMWSVWLPRYSTLAWRCVWVLVVTGLVDAAVRLGGVSALLGTGYGRIVMAKIVALVGLLAVGWWWRRTWVPAASQHRVSADISVRRATGEVTLMALAFGLAAALATTA